MARVARFFTGSLLLGTRFFVEILLFESKSERLDSVDSLAGHLFYSAISEQCASAAIFERFFVLGQIWKNSFRELLLGMKSASVGSSFAMLCYDGI